MQAFFNANCFLLDGVTPTVWTIEVVIPYHTGKLLEKHNFWARSKLCAGQGGKAYYISIICIFDGLVG